jgi:hypothetical protein
MLMPAIDIPSTACVKPLWIDVRVLFSPSFHCCLVVVVSIASSFSFSAEHWIFFAIDVDFVPSATLYASLAANSDWLTSVAPSG